MNLASAASEQPPLADATRAAAGRYVRLSLAIVLLHVVFMLFRYGHLPIAPVLGDEVIINDASIALAHGHGYVATSFAGGKYYLDRVFAHFPPVYPYTESLAFRAFGVSAYSLRCTTTVMSVASTVVLFLLLYRLCRAGLLGWNTALLLNAIYGTNVALISLERVARMESMIGVLTLLSLGAVFYAATQPAGGRTWPAVVCAGACGALSTVVHPEAITALLLVVPLLVFLVPAKTSVRLLSVALFAVIPVAIGLLVYGAQVGTAVRQLATIARDANRVSPSSHDWIVSALHEHAPSAVNRNLFLGLLLLLFAAAPVAYLLVVRRLPRASFRFRLGACFAVVAVLELLLMIFVFRMDDRRFQFLFGPVLVCSALAFVGAAPLRRWQSGLGWALVGLQCVGTALYLGGKRGQPVDTDPARFLGLIRTLPAGATIGTTPGLWLDFQQAGRPFTLIYYGLGESGWDRSHGNPFARFDVVLLEEGEAANKPWYRLEAEEGRTMRSYTVGSDVVDVYVRSSGVAAR